MKTFVIASPAHHLSSEVQDDAAQVLDWFDDLVAVGIAEFEHNPDEFPFFRLLSGETFVLGDSSITRLR